MTMARRSPRFSNHRFLLLFCLLAALGLPPALWAQTNYENYTFTTLAGPRESPGWFDGSPTAAGFYHPFGVAADSQGNLYVADSFNATIRKVTSAGIVTTLAGLAGNTGSTNATGSAARFNNPTDVAVDANGIVYVADNSNHLIRKITPEGIVTTLVGSAGSPGSADGTNGTARFYYPAGVAVDQNGNLFVADSYNHTIRKVTPAGVVTTMAGSAGQAGDADGTGNAARFNNPTGVAVDNAGNLYVADNGNHTIRVVAPSGAVTTLAGKPGVSGSANGSGGAARFNRPFDLDLGTDGNLYVADTYNHTIRVVTLAGKVTTLAGSAGNSGGTDGAGNAARFTYPTGLAFDSNGHLQVADFGDNTIRDVTTDGVVSTLAGTPGNLGDADGAGNDARFRYPAGLARDADGNVYVADLANHTLRKITPAGEVTTLAGKPGVPGSANGTGSAARFFNPTGLAMDADGNLYVADSHNQTIRKVTSAGKVTTFAGSAGKTGSADGSGSNARFYNPFDVAVDADGNVFVADAWNHTIRKITPGGAVSTLAGSAGHSGSADGSGSAASFFYPEGVAVDQDGNVYVADNGNNTIRKITPDGAVTTLAGKANNNSGSVDGSGADARFYAPFGIAVDANRNLYVTDSGNNTLRKIAPDGAVTTLAGRPANPGTADGTGKNARLFNPEGVTLAPDGTIFVADTSNHTIRRGYPAPPDTPTADPAVAKPGALRQLDVTSLTTTSWSWRIVRRPAGSSASLSSTTAQNPAFTPDVAGLYTVRFQGTDAAGKEAIVFLDLDTRDSSQPQIAGGRMMGSTFVFTGTGGSPGAAYSVLATGNPALPLDQWTVLPGGSFDPDGHFAVSNQTAEPFSFYLLRTP